MEPVLIIGLFILVAAAIGVYGYYRREQRRKELAAWAETRGLQFDPGRYWDMDESYPAFSCLKEGNRRYAYNVMGGKRNDRVLLAFDYHYETYSTNSKGHRQTHHHYFSAIIVETGLPLKSLVIRPEGFFDRITEFFGFDDIDFESAEFSRKFYVKSPDKRWAYDVIHQETMEFLLSSPTYTLEIDGPRVIAFRKSTFSTREFDEAIQLIEGVLDRIPQSVLQELVEVE